MVLFYDLQNDVTVMLPNEFAKMTEICKIKLGIICILKHTFWPGYICCLCAYVTSWLIIKSIVFLWFTWKPILYIVAFYC